MKIMRKSMIIFLLAALLIAGAPTTGAYPDRTTACQPCHQYPPQLLNITTNVTSLTVIPGEFFNVNITWSGGANDGTIKTAVKWPDVQDNALFDLDPGIPVALGTEANGTALSILKAPAATGSYIVRVYAATGSWAGIHEKEANYTDISVTVEAPPASGAPNITGFSPQVLTVTNNVSESRTFSITLNQTANVSWFINGTQVQSNESVTTAGYTNTSAAEGIWNVTAVADNFNGTVMQEWDWIVTQSQTPGSPVITNYSPTSPVGDNAGAARTFNVTLNQTSNVTWFINGTQVQFNESVTGASYTNTSAAEGVWNVTAMAENLFGTVKKTWDWIVAASVPSTSTPVITGSAPGHTVSDIVGAERSFNITIDQTVNVTWMINGMEVQFNKSVTGAKYTNTSAATGAWNVTAVAENTNGTDMRVWDWTVSPEVPSSGAPAITGFSPATSVSDTAGDARTFSITINRTANVKWFINGMEVQSNESVTGAKYANTSAARGTWIVNATAYNDNGTDSKEWTWKVTKSIPSKKIEAGVKIKPETLNLASKGKFKAFITLPEGYDVADIDPGTVVCEDAPAINSKVSRKNGGTLIVTFKRQDLSDIPAGNADTLWVTGKVLSSGEWIDFEGSDTIKVMDNGRGRKHDDDDEDDEDDREDDEDDEDYHENAKSSNTINSNTVNINIDNNNGDIRIINNFNNNPGKDGNDRVKDKSRSSKKKNKDKNKKDD